MKTIAVWTAVEASALGHQSSLRTAVEPGRDCSIMIMAVATVRTRTKIPTAFSLYVCVARTYRSVWDTGTALRNSIRLGTVI